jgi:recombination protein RecA
MREDLKKDIEKKYGINIVSSAQHIVDNPKDAISISPAFDIGLGGPIPKGTFAMISALFSYGKTTTSLSFASNAQKAGMEIYYDNIEHRLKPRDLRGIKGLDIEKINVIESKPGKILSAEDHLQIEDDILNNEQNVVVIQDSASQLCSADEFACAIGDKKRAPGAVLLAQFTKKIKSVLPVNNNILICIVHMIANTGGSYGGMTESGGNKIKYAANMHVRAKTMEYLNVGTNDPYGQKVTWEVQKSPIGPPKCKIESFIRYGVGIDEISELINLGVQLAIIQQGGAWFTLEDKKAQGQEKLYKLLLDDTELLKELKRKVYGAVGVEYA